MRIALPGTEIKVSITAALKPQINVERVENNLVHIASGISVVRFNYIVHGMSTCKYGFTACINTLKLRDERFAREELPCRIEELVALSLVVNKIFSKFKAVTSAELSHSKSLQNLVVIFEVTLAVSSTQEILHVSKRDFVGHRKRSHNINAFCILLGEIDEIHSVGYDQTERCNLIAHIRQETEALIVVSVELCRS